jgi:copper(I)-binding protein
MLRSSSLLATTLLLAATAQAQQFSADSLVIDHAWARPTAAGMPTGVAYLSITNHGVRADTLLSARTPVALRVEFHRTSFEGGMAKMRPASPLVIAPGATLAAAPGGLHLMLVELAAPLADGTTVPLVLTFKDAGDVTVQLRIESHDDVGRAAVSN